jgi:SAM-dependent methyltransferase
MNPYSYFQRAIHCAKTNGIKEVFAIPARMLATPLVKCFREGKRFQFNGQSLPYLNHRYNATWSNERCVEVPIGQQYVCDAKSLGKDVLEIGNVLSHYHSTEHTIIDKYERFPFVLNKDVLEITGRYDLILSISTFEHIGFDEEQKDDTKIARAIDHCRRMLVPGGKLVITASAGYNHNFDDLMLQCFVTQSAKMSFMRRTNYFNWKECSVGFFAHARYNHPYPFGNAIVVAEFSSL